jgi:hypothetical protein
MCNAPVRGRLILTTWDGEGSNVRYTLPGAGPSIGGAVMTMPVRKDWVALKKTHKVPDGAVKGVNLGAALDKIKDAKTGPTIVAAVTAFEKIANTYITKLDKKSVTNYATFQKTFLDDYLAPAHTRVKAYKLEADQEALYKSELTKFFQAVQKLDPKKTTPDDAQTFGRFARGLFSVSLRTKDAVDATAINKALQLIYKADEKVSWKKASQSDVSTFVFKVRGVASEVAKLAKAQGLT